MKETGLKVGCFAGFFHDCVIAMTLRMLKYQYSLFT